MHVQKCLDGIPPRFVLQLCYIFTCHPCLCVNSLLFKFPVDLADQFFLLCYLGKISLIPSALFDDLILFLTIFLHLSQTVCNIFPFSKKLISGIADLFPQTVKTGLFFRRIYGHSGKITQNRLFLRSAAKLRQHIQQFFYFPLEDLKLIFFLLQLLFLPLICLALLL